MPLMPTSWRASFTSSSLNGLMIASIFFMGPCLGLILPVLKQAACQTTPAPDSRHPQDADARDKPRHHNDHRSGERAGCLNIGQPAVSLGGVAPLQPFADPPHGEADILDAVGVGDPQIA